jgi:hypothetical protein
MISFQNTSAWITGLYDKRIKDKDGNCNEGKVVTEEPGMMPDWGTRRKTAAARCRAWHGQLLEKNWTGQAANSG